MVLVATKSLIASTVHDEELKTYENGENDELLLEIVVKLGLKIR